MARTLHDFPLFQRFTEAWKPLLPAIAVHRYNKGETIAAHGDAAEMLWLIIEGWVGLTRTTPDGRSITVGLFTAGDLFGEAALFPESTYPYHAEVIQDGTILAAIPAHALRQRIRTTPPLSHYLMKVLGDRMAGAQLTLEQRSSLTAAQRLGCFLLRLCAHAEGDRHHIAMPVEKHIVASYLGMKPETLSRSFQQLASIGIAVDHARIEVKHIPQLRDYVCSSCGESGLCATEATLATPPG